MKPKRKFEDPEKVRSSFPSSVNTEYGITGSTVVSFVELVGNGSTSESSCCKNDSRVLWV
jgi:hypothetical protein